MKKACCDKEDMKKGAWSKQEDQKLIDYINKHGEGRWRSLPEAAGLLRCGNSCRLRWINYLKPDLKRGNFAEDEEDLIIKLHALLGNRWSLIAGRLPGRTDNEVKNYWNSHLRRKLISMGIDPKNHRRLSLPQNQALLDTSTTTSTCSSNTSPSPSHTTTQAGVFRPLIVKSSAGRTCTADQVIVSDSGSCCMEEEEQDQYYSSSDLLPDLNLDPPLPSIYT